MSILFTIFCNLWVRRISQNFLRKIVKKSKGEILDEYIERGIRRTYQAPLPQFKAVQDNSDGVSYRRLICTLGEALLNLYGMAGLNKDEAGALTSITLVFLSILFTGLEWYDRIAQHAGAGTLVPITGFANAVASPALDFKSEGFVLGLGAKMFVIAGPVIVYGISASVVYGIIYYIVGLFTK